MYENKCSRREDLTSWTANRSQWRPVSEILWWFAHSNVPPWILAKNVVLGQSFPYWCFYCWVQGGPRGSEGQTDSNMWLTFLRRLGAARFSSKPRNSRWKIEAEGGTGESNFASILSNCYSLPVSNCATAQRKQFFLIKMLKSFTPSWSPLSTLSEFKSTFPLIPKHPCSSGRVWKAVSLFLFFLH